MASLGQAVVTDPTETLAPEQKGGQQAAPCSQSFPTHSQRLAELKALSRSGEKRNYAVGGLFLHDENETLIAAYHRLTTYKDFRGFPMADIDFWSKFKNTKCDKTLCAAQAVFGEELGTLYLYVAAIYGINLSSLGYDRLKPPNPDNAEEVKEIKAWLTVRPWSLQELTPYLNALAQLPKSFLPFQGAVRLNHAGILNPLNEEAFAVELISVYSLIDKLSDFQKETVVYHELGHVVANIAKSDFTPEWLAASGWHIKDEKVVSDPTNKGVSAYAQQNFFEDFAETFLFYRYFPEALKMKAPSRYAYMKNAIYEGKEYLHCSPSLTADFKEK